MQRSPVIAFHTLGCKLNQAESEMIASEALREDYVDFSGNACTYIVYTSDLHAIL